MKSIVLALLVMLSLSADELKINDTLKDMEVKTQFDKSGHILPHKYIIYTWSKELTQIANNVFEKEPKLLDGNIMVVDSSQIPWGIRKLFVMPRMQSYKHDIFMNDDEVYNRAIPYKENSITILKMNGDKIEEIIFVEDEKELEKELKK